MITSELKAIYTNQNSFYGKATTTTNKNTIILKSYNTNILEYNTTTKKITFLTHNKDHFTQTTNKHINEFLKQYTNETTKTKKELLKMAQAI